MRAPITHVHGDLVVKDVCGVCNNGVLSNLDGYGKELYGRYFANPAYAGDVVSFEYDGDRLLRWLLKLSYNSARAQNADVLVLHKYRKAILGEVPLADRVRCWLQLVTATYFDEAAKVARPARPEERGQEHVEEPLWFRICQFRLPSIPALNFVQRRILINSFAFTLLIAKADSDWPCTGFDQWGKAFTGLFPDAIPVLPAQGSLTVSAGSTSSAESIFWLFANWPSRFSENPDPFVTHALNPRKDDVPAVVLHVPRELIEIGDSSFHVSTLRDMVSTREKAAAYRQRVGMMVDGFDKDAEGLWQFPKVRQFFRRLFVECPFVMLLADPDGDLLKLLAACWVYEDQLTEDVEQQRTSEFVNRALVGLNQVTHRLALSEEQNREICRSACKTLFNEVPPI